ncbi:MAG: hypothetical protein ACOCRO_10210 [Halanaerobiales bacterium]
MNKRAKTLLQDKVLPWTYRWIIMSNFEDIRETIKTPQFINSFLTAAMPPIFKKGYSGETFFPSSIKSENMKIYAYKGMGNLVFKSEMEIEGRSTELEFSFDEKGSIDRGIINYIHFESGEIRQLNLLKN